MFPKHVDRLDSRDVFSMQLSLHEWRSSQSALPEGAKVFADDWCSVDEKGDYHARLYYFQENNLQGSWCWRVWVDQKLLKGNAQTRSEARDACERLLLKHGIIDSYLERRL